MKERYKEIDENFRRITGAKGLDSGFGEPFIQAFEKFIQQDMEGIRIASYTCSLFLSVVFNRFPTEKLHTFVHFTKEHYMRFSFNCKMYEEIFSYMDENKLKEVSLLDAEGGYMNRKCSKQDIFEAFDFYTNT